MKNFRELALNAITAVAVGCALLVTGAAYRRGTLFGNETAKAQGAADIRPVANWQRFLNTGFRIGPSDAAVTIVEFGDFECPFCAASARRLDTVRAKHPKDFAIVYHNTPLPYHKSAYPLARASVCAASVGRFTQFHDEVFAHPESIEVRPIPRIAKSAGIADTGRFHSCLTDTSRVASIETDIAEARSIETHGTPSFIVDGNLRGGDLTVADFDTIVAKRVKGRQK